MTIFIERVNVKITLSGLSLWSLMATRSSCWIIVTDPFVRAHAKCMGSSPLGWNHGG